MENHAIQMGNVQVEFEALYGTMIKKNKLNQKDAISELLRISTRKGLNYKAFSYVESYILRKYFDEK